jgi:hypothetical protein
VHVDERAEGWLDQRVYDCDGELLGKVVNVYDSASTGGPAWLAIGMGTFGMRMAVVPLRGAVRWGADVVVAHDRLTVIAAPPGDISVTLEPNDEAQLVAHYAARHRSVPHPSRPFGRKHLAT